VFAGKLVRWCNRDDVVRPEQLFETAPVRQHRTIHTSIVMLLAGNLFGALPRNKLGGGFNFQPIHKQVQIRRVFIVCALWKRAALFTAGRWRCEFAFEIAGSGLPVMEPRGLIGIELKNIFVQLNVRIDLIRRVLLLRRSGP
jgi:hypothetical protein